MEEELKLQLAFEWGDKAFPIDWNRLPSEIMDKIPPEYYCNVLSWVKEKEIREKTVVYFRQVKKFKKGIVEYKDDNIIFGI